MHDSFSFKAKSTFRAHSEFKEGSLGELGVRSADIVKRFVGHMVGTNVEGLCQARTESK